MNSALIAYLLDAHREFAIESQVIIFVWKNFFAFGLGFFFVPWWSSAGPKVVWNVIAGESTGVVLLAIPLYVFGKRLRAFWMRHPFFGISSMHH